MHRCSRQRAQGWLFAVSIVVGCASCSKKSATPVYPVTGEVYFNQKPTTGALVIFHPLQKESEGGKPFPKPRGYVQADGSFQLTTFAAKDGAPAGKYVVTVYWREQEDDDAPPGRFLAPKRYASQETSPLGAEIQPGNNKLEALHLKSE